MPKERSGKNPFYVVLVLVGVVFSLTAIAYGILAFKGSQPGGEEVVAAHPLLSFMSQRGGMLLMGELLLLAIATAGAIGSDSYWTGTDRK